MKFHKVVSVILLLGFLPFFALISCSTPYNAPSLNGSTVIAPGGSHPSEEVDTFNKKLLIALGQVRPSEYRLMPGDVVEVSVFGIKELQDLKGTIGATQRVSLPLVGSVKIGGLTIPEAEKALVKPFKKYVSSPKVSLAVKEYHGYRVSVLGEVNKPDVYSLRGTGTVLDGIAMAGGLTQDASRTVILTHMEPGKKSSTYVNLDELIKQRNLSNKLLLKPGDIIYVPKAKHIFVDGFVRRPKAIPITQPITLMEAIAKAGGMVIDADPGHITIYRPLKTGGRKIIQVNLDEIRNGTRKDVKLAPNDIVVVPSSGIKVFVYRFFGVGVGPGGPSVRTGGR